MGLGFWADNHSSVSGRPRDKGSVIVEDWQNHGGPK